ncbi:MAG: ABC transporter ATP-binding protein [Bacilli bacterium]|jgi:ATP-binding cassette subfamily B protein
MNDFKTKDFILHFSKKHLILVILLAFMIIGASVSSLLPSYALKYLIDGVINPLLASQAQINQKEILLATGAYFGSYLLVGFFTIFENYMIDLYGQKMIHELRYAMIEKSHRIQSSYFTRNGTGTMTSRVTDDVNSIEMLFAEGLVSLLVNFFKIIGILISVFVFSWILGLILLLLIPIVFFVTQSFRKKMLKNQLSNRKLVNQETNNLSETIDSSLVIKNLSKEGYRQNQFTGLLNKDYQVMDKTAWLDSLYSPIIEMLKAITISAVTLLVAYSINSTDSLMGLSIGTFAAAMSLISSVFSPIESIGQELQTMQEGTSGIKRVEKFMNEPEICKKNPAFTSQVVSKSVDYKPLLQFKNLSFHYDDGTELIYNGMNLTINKLDKVTLVGRTGVGKTTLFRLVMGILEPTSGEIDLNGYNVSLIPDPEKRALFGYVQQDFKFIPGTIEDQITLKDPTISLTQVRKAMQDAFLDDYVMSHIEGGYEAKFNEEDFSRGQLQLLNLARAMVLNPQLLLLDEISANLDSKTEKQVIDALAKATSERTVISISHRLSDQLGFTKVIEVRDGKAY